jgi:uncharacterized membrane protein
MHATRDTNDFMFQQRGLRARDARRYAFEVEVKMSKVKEVLLTAAIVLLGSLLGGSFYDLLVNAPNFSADIPQSLEAFRGSMLVASPGNFFRLFAPLTEVSLLISLILGWRSPVGRRWWLLAAFLLILTGDVITFTYHYPRNALLFHDPLHTPVEALRQAAVEWVYGNYVRVTLVLVAMVCAIQGMRAGRRSTVA